MGCCSSTAATDRAPPGSLATPPASRHGGAPALVFTTKPSRPVGDAAVPPARRCMFAVVMPASTGARPCHLFVDREKPVEAILHAAASHGGFAVDKGKLVGSPERLNLFTFPEGEVVRLDLEVDAHLGATLHEGRLLVLEKGNRLSDERCRALQAALGR